uniref:Kinesin motor domain-containing protein n=1 Tax=viral metagenome TaxID=1070528 RepID=A0A6C0JMW6_9ZZZZ
MSENNYYLIHCKKESFKIHAIFLNTELNLESTTLKVNKSDNFECKFFNDKCNNYPKEGCIEINSDNSKKKFSSDDDVVYIFYNEKNGIFYYSLNKHNLLPDAYNSGNPMVFGDNWVMEQDINKLNTIIVDYYNKKDLIKLALNILSKSELNKSEETISNLISKYAHSSIIKGLDDELIKTLNALNRFKNKSNEKRGDRNGNANIFAHAIKVVDSEEEEDNDSDVDEESVKMLVEGVSKSKGGFSNKNINKANNLIDAFVDTVNSILLDPYIFKLTSISSNELKVLFINENSIIADPFTINDSINYYDKGSRQIILTNLIKFLYIDLTDLKNKNDEINLLLFSKNNDNFNYHSYNKKDHVIKYKKNYYELTNSNSTENNDNLIIYISEFLRLIDNFKKYIEYTESMPNTGFDVYNIIIIYIRDYILRIEYMITKFIPILYYDANKQHIIDKLQLTIAYNSSSNIITYLKLRNDDHLNNVYNSRFNLLVNKKNIHNDVYNTIIVDYNDDNIPYYKGDNASEMSDELQILKIDQNKIIQQKYDFSQFERIKKIIIKKYDYRYIFGKFSRIFLPDLNNEKISIEMDIIIDKLGGKQGDDLKYTQTPVPVFMLGYGASGAGKTSSLIFYNKGKLDKDKDLDEQTGILIHLCNKVSVKDGHVHYNTIKLRSREFYHVNDNKIDYLKENFRNNADKYQQEILKLLEKPEIVSVPDNSTTGFIEFEYKVGIGFVLKAQYEHKNHHQYRSIKVGNSVEESSASLEKTWKEYTHKDDGKIYYENNKETGKEYNEKNNEKPENTIIDYKVFNAGTSLGEVIIHLIDKDRFVKATTNNPNSSRSHTLVFVELSDSTPDTKILPANLIIGDFAGVENAFKCDDQSTIEKFLAVKRDNTDMPYYSTELYKGNPDPFGIIEQKGGMKVSDSCKPHILSQDDIYDFENPKVRESWELSAELEEYYKNGNNLKLAIDVIRNYIGTYGLKVGNTDYNEENIKTKYVEGSKNFAYFLKIYLDSLDALDALGENKILSQIKTELNEILEIAVINNSNASYKFVPHISNNDNSTYCLIDYFNTNNSMKEYFINFTQNDMQKKNYKEKYKLHIYNLNNTKGIIINDRLKVKSRNFWNFFNVIKIYLNKKVSNFTGNTTIQKIENLYSTMSESIKLYSSLSLTQREEIKKFFMDFRRSLEPLINELFEKIKNELQNKAKDKFYSILKEYNYDTIKNLFDSIFQSHDKVNFNSNSNVPKRTMIDIVKDLELESLCRIGNSKVICENRREEGYFINDSLFKVREVIKKILYEKNKDKINISPNFVDICMDNYCPSHKNCFSFESFDKENSKHSTGSVIFDEIYKVLYPEGSQPIKTYQEFYKELIVSIFCVFNISKKANNPPPTPYMDINKLKSLFYYGDIFEDKQTEEFINEGRKIIEMINTTPAPANDTTDTAPPAPIDTTTNTASAIDTAHAPSPVPVPAPTTTPTTAPTTTPTTAPTTIENIHGFGDKVSGLKTIKSTVTNGSIFDNFNDIINELYSNKLNIKDNYTRESMFKNQIKEFIDMIDKSNAVSAIGTLEFLDQISKFNTTETICTNTLFTNNENDTVVKTFSQGFQAIY